MVGKGLYTHMTGVSRIKYRYMYKLWGQPDIPSPVGTVSTHSLSSSSCLKPPGGRAGSYLSGLLFPKADTGEKGRKKRKVRVCWPQRTCSVTLSGFLNLPELWSPLENGVPLSCLSPCLLIPQGGLSQPSLSKLGHAPWGHYNCYPH